MRFGHVTMLALVALLAACSQGPKDTVIPTDPDKWKDLKPAVQKLDEQDQKLLTLYLLRVAMRSKIVGEPIPADVTIGKAIEDEKGFLAKNPPPQ